MTMTIAENPYVGPRPFTSSDRGVFFGRDREADTLIPMVIAERLVLFYAQSGAGKSSLIHARLLPGLVERNFLVLPVGRVSGDRSPGLPVDNLFIYNLLTRLDQVNLDQGKTTLDRLANLTLSEYLADLELATADPEAESGLHFDAPQVIDGVQPIALIIDQFEEIFTNHPESWKHRKGFFEQLNQAMQADPYLWVVLVMREDYVAELDPYASLLPGRLRARFYMQRMGYQAALQAVQKPVEQLRPFETGVAEKLVNNLRMIAINDGSGQVRFVEDEFVEPVQLQVVCHQLWQNLAEQPGPTISDAHLASLAKDGDLAHFINRALSDFYEQALAAVLQESGDRISERQLREWFARQLITEAETRGSAFMGDRTTAGLPNAVVFLLEARFILRSETRAAGKWYELSHDRFIGPILKSNREWQERNPLAVLADAEAWQAAGHSPQKLYEGRRLADALEQLHRRPDDFSPLEQSFLREGERVAERARTSRQRLIVTVLTVISLVLIGLSAISVLAANAARTQSQLAQVQSTSAFNNLQTAEAERVKALEAEAIAEENEAIAVYQGHLAQTAEAQASEQRKIALTKQVEADQQRARAVLEARKAKASQFASLSTYYQDSAPNLSLMYAISAVQQFDGWESRANLFQLIQRSMDNPISQIGLPITAGAYANQVAFSPDGMRIAAGLRLNMDMWDIKGKGITPVLNLPKELKSGFGINSVSFDSTNTYFARGGSDGQVIIWNMKTGELLPPFIPFSEPYPAINSVAFQPGGLLLAVASANGEADKLGTVFLLDVETGKVINRLECMQQSCMKVAWSPDGSFLAVGTGFTGKQGGDVLVLDPNNRFDILLYRPKAHTGPVRSLAWYPDGLRLASAGNDQRIRVWNVKTSELLQQSDTGITPPALNTMAVSPDGALLLTSAYQEEGFYIWDAKLLQRKQLVTFGALGVTAIAFNQQGNRFVTADFDSSIALWSYGLEKPLSSLQYEAQSQGVFGVLLASDGYLVFGRSSGQDGQVSTWGHSDDWITLDPYATGSGLAMLDGQPVTLIAGAGQIAFLDPNTGSETRPALSIEPERVRLPTLSEDGLRLAAAQCTTATECKKLVLWNLETNRQIELPKLTEHFGTIVSLAIDGKTSTIAVGTNEGQIFLYNYRTNDIYQIITKQNMVPTSLALTSEDDLLAVGYGSGQIDLWQRSTASPVGEFVERAGGKITGLTFIRQDQFSNLSLLSVTESGEVQEWMTSLASWIERACAMMDGPLTTEERSQLLGSDIGEIPCQ